MGFEMKLGVLICLGLVALCHKSASAEDDLAPSKLTGAETQEVLLPWMDTADLKSKIDTVPALVSKNTFHWVLADGSLWTSFTPVGPGRVGVIYWEVKSDSANIKGGPSYDLNQTMSYYYLDPQPDKVEGAITASSRLGLFDSVGRAPVVVSFLSQVFRRNPSRLAAWLEGVQGLPLTTRQRVYEAVWKSDTPESKIVLVEFQFRDEDDREEVEEMLSQVPSDVLVEEISEPRDLDELWSAFSATGDKRYVERIISVLSWDDRQASGVENGKGLLVGAAKWSLSSQARQHPIVQQVCREAAEAVDETTKTTLLGLLPDTEQAP
ncbi:MAG: hypothetical protein AAGA92_06520 [Planctomycetota bacterium]